MQGSQECLLVVATMFSVIFLLRESGESGGQPTCLPARLGIWVCHCIPPLIGQVLGRAGSGLGPRWGWEG